MVKAIMHGCNGHMGQVITNLLKKDTQAQIVAGIDPFDEGKNDYPVFPSIDKCDVDADVIIDFASAKAIGWSGRLLCGKKYSGCNMHNRT